MATKNTNAKKSNFIKNMVKMFGFDTKSKKLQFKGGFYLALSQFFRNHTLSVCVMYAFSVIIGSLLPITAYNAKHMLDYTWHGAFIGIIMLGCMIFSLPSLYKFGLIMFDNKKALGFSVALEFIMLANFSKLSPLALAIVCSINVLSVFYNASTGKSLETILNELQAKKKS